MRPCTRCRRRFRGSAQHLYPAVLSLVSEDRAKHSLCGDCFDHNMRFVRDRLAYVDYDAEPEGADAERAGCCICGFSEEIVGTVFVTAYGRDTERRDYYGKVCGGHVDQVRDQLIAVQSELARDAA